MATTNAQIQALLNANGFPCGPADGVIGPNTRAAVARFQRAYNGPDPWLTIDGVPGPKTQHALSAIPGFLSAHFHVAEVACHHCGQAYVRRELLAALEDLRTYLLGPVVLISAYRCKQHNGDVGGASASMHLEGLAADTDIDAHVAAVSRLELFSGIGDKDSVVKHVDLRHLSSKNLTPNATGVNPARWHY